MNRVDNVHSHLVDNRYVRVERRGVAGLIRFLRSAPPRSQVGGCVLCASMRAQILRALRTLEADPSCLVIVLASTSDRFFSSGIDIADFSEAFVSDATQQPPVPSLSELTAAVEASPKVCIAAVQGLCSSWGLELALAADYRVCAINAKFRFPEVVFGITPCGGGARRLVCRVGVPHALTMLCYGKPVYAHDAKGMGLIDAAPCHGPQLWEALTVFIRTHVAASAKDGLLTLQDAQAAKELAQRRRRSCPSYAQLPFFNRGWYAWTEHKLRETVPRARQAPYRALEAVRIAVTHSLLSCASEASAAGAGGGGGVDIDRSVATHVRHDTAYTAAERSLFDRCLASSEAQAMQHLLRASQRTSMAWEKDYFTPPQPVPMPVVSPSATLKGDSAATTITTTAAAPSLHFSFHVDEPTMEASLGVRKVAVLGAGTMGTSIALMLLWQREMEAVVLIESGAERQERAVRAIEEHLRGRVTAHRLSPHRCEEMLQRLYATGDPNLPFPPLLADMDVVLECAPEVPALKQNIMAHLDQICKRSAILVTVSSAQDVDKLAAVTRRPGQVVGLHFFPPANHSPVVEVIRGAATDRWVVERLMRLFTCLDKFPIVSRSGHGCVGTRLLLAALYQAYAMLEDGCFPMQIDFALRKTFNFTRGLFELEDIMGLDSTAAVRAAMLRDTDLASRPTSVPLSTRAALSTTKQIPVSTPSAEEVSNQWWLPSRPVFDIANALIEAGALGRKTREGWYIYATPEECTLGYALRHPIKSWLWMPSTPPAHIAVPVAATAPAGASWSTEKQLSAVVGQSAIPSCPPVSADSPLCGVPQQSRYRFPLVSLEALVPQHNYSVEYRTLSVSKRHKCTRRPFRDDEIVERIVFAMVNEAAKMMADGIITNAADIDCISVHAFGFPAWKGGLCYFADNVAGIERVVFKMKVFQRALGSEEFPFPCTALQEMLANGQTFASISK
jgi:3-hydroxyacyl-CoA dehydrogenase/enoyl-CoA hydratase/carnithine racemase